VTVTAAELGGVPTAEVTIDGVEPRHVVLYFHGGVYVLGDAFQSAGLAAAVARRTQAKVISVDYRLAPEHPYPAAVDDALAAYKALLDNGTAPSGIAFAGESAAAASPSHPGQRPRSRPCPCPPRPSPCHRMSTSPWPGRPWKPSARPTRCSAGRRFQFRVPDYTAGQDAALGLISPIFADLSGLPP